ncbi:MAG: T9SS type A sorting domain-containing protein [Flavobacteriia bacterium]|nr:T9SS type A sorting domain-containing protein [Flavobacteriia bacterium]OJX39101.1 MAG: hypothetical protein BGO87_03705 [Flavobacteriia bacterium 40-80]
MKYGLLFFLCVIFLPLLSQGWLKSGAEWHYYSNGEGLQVYHHMKLEGDVIISGKTYQKVFNQRYLYFPVSPSKDTLTNYGSESFLYRMNGDTLFQLIHFQDTTFEDIVIIFRDQAHWQSRSNLNDTSCTQTPDYTSTFYNTETVNGITDSIFIVTVSNVYDREDFMMGPYSRRFGCNSGDFTPRYDCIHEIAIFSVYYQLLCYQDNEGFSIKNVQNECDYYLTLNTGELSRNNISIYPNPATSKVTIQSEIALDEVSLYDLQGKKLPVQLDFNLKQIDISNFKPGIYFLEITFEKMKITEKLMIE